MTRKKMTQSTQYLTFKLDKEIYAIEIDQVREVLDLIEITGIPGMPPYTRGIINLRDKVVPVMDLKLKFNMPATLETVDTCIIILDFIIDEESYLIGILADSVLEVLTLEPDQFEPASKMGTRVKSGFIKGIGKKDKLFFIILDLDQVFSAEEMELASVTENLSPDENDDPEIERLETGGKEAS